MMARAWLPGRSSRPGPGRKLPSLADMRFVVVDIDVTGTDVRRDRVTGIAALPLEGGKFRLADLAYCDLPDGHAPDRAERLRDFAALRQRIADSPVVTYNARFVRRMIAHACSELGAPALDGEWIDLASATAVVAEEEAELASVDYWLDRMKAGGRWPHDAAFDVFAMAQLLEVVIAYAGDFGVESVESLARAQKARAWLRGG
jgi:DNA polymerase III epsilon subunit-like protein